MTRTRAQLSDDLERERAGRAVERVCWALVVAALILKGWLAC